MTEYLQKAKEAKSVLASLSGETRNKVLYALAKGLRDATPEILEANKVDIEYAKDNKLSASMQERLMLDEKRVEAMAASVEVIAGLRDPLGRVLDGWSQPNGLKIQKVAIPIGVIAIIYESRPNVTSDTAALCFKSGNVAVLKGGKEAVNSNNAIAKAMGQVLESFSLPKEIISMLPDSSREGVMNLVKMDRYVDLIIPRGGESLIRAVCENATVPVVKHDKGVCNLFLDESADADMSISIAVNAKVQRPSVCNSIETLLVHKNAANRLLPLLKAAFDEKNTVLKGCDKTLGIVSVAQVTEEDYYTEYGENILNIKIVESIDEAIKHISKYGSGHSDSIVTENYRNAEYFLDSVDSACVYVNASTRFTDGGEFGFGAEVGISTNKLHSRGPMGVDDLTTYKYKIFGSGQVRG